jgi:quinone-modifying oxidoreductase, subunit QmoC
MAVRANPRLVDELQRYGAEDVSKCFHCGNCTAACQLSESSFLFPRRSMRALQMGLEDRLRSSLDPWLCYYCGDCSEQCPRGADPGETMMSMRRWLTAQYDFTGISRLFYRSPATQVAAMLGIAIATGAGFVAYALLRGGGSLSAYDGPQAFLPERAVHLFDWAMGGALFALLLVNCLRMWSFTMRGDRAPRVPASAYLRHALLLPLHFFTQRRYRQCKNTGPWGVHLALMLSYVTMLVLIVFFLPEMQHGPEVRWGVHVFGYLATIGLLVGTILALRGRLERRAAHHKHSHASDWIFLVMLLALAVTGIVQHLLHRAGLPAAANVAYLVHLMIIAPFEITQVPFGKWSHMAYRPLAIYLARVQQAAQAATSPAVEEPVPAARAV